jgi:hypothetical protein
MQDSSFNLVTTVAVLQKQWKTIVLFVITTAVVTAVTVFLVPQYFRSTAIIVSANPLLADKARLFNSNIKDLYSYFGNGDDLDRIDGIAEMDTTYKKLVDDFSLINYYELKGDSLPIRRRKAVLLLRKDISIQKTEQGQLKIIAWTKDKQLSASLVNQMVAILQQREADIWEKNYNNSLAVLTGSIEKIEKEYQLLSDSLSTNNQARHELVVAKMQTLLEQVKQYRKTADEFALAIETHPVALYVMESAVPAAKAERPYKPAIILASLLISFIFSCLLVLVNNRKYTA